MSNRSYFQLSFMTSMFLIMICYSGAKLDGDHYFSYSCISKVEWKHSAKKDTDGPEIAFGNSIITEIPPCVETIDDVRVVTWTDVPSNHITIRSDTTSYVSLHFFTTVFFSILWVIYMIFWRLIPLT